MRSLRIYCMASVIILNNSRILLPDLKNLRQKIKLSDTDEGDGNVLTIQRCPSLTAHQLYQQ